MTRGRGVTEKPDGAWSPEQVADYLYKKMNEGKFYVICPDNDVDWETDRKRMTWTVSNATVYLISRPRNANTVPTRWATSSSSDSHNLGGETSTKKRHKRQWIKCSWAKNRWIDSVSSSLILSK